MCKCEARLEPPSIADRPLHEAGHIRLQASRLFCQKPQPRQAR